MQSDSNNQNPIVEISNLTVKFGDFIALEDLSFKINYGEIYGLIGPNGAGKTTTINSILGLLKYSNEAKISLFGEQLSNGSKKFAQKIGYMPQDITLYSDISIEQNLKFFSKLYGMNNKKINDRIKHVLELVELSAFADRVISKCSGGMQRRASLACALIHEPELLILDEPTVGIDPELRMVFWDYFRALSEKGKTILITTHYLGESIKCDKVGLIRKSLVVEGTPKKLQNIVKVNQNLAELPDMEDVFIYYTHQSKMEVL